MALKVAPCERSFINIPSRMFSQWSYIIPALHCASVQYPYAPVPHHDTCWSPATKDTYRSCTIVHSGRHWLQACSPSIIHCPSPALLCWPYDVTFELCKVKAGRGLVSLTHPQPACEVDSIMMYLAMFQQLWQHAHAQANWKRHKTTRLHAHWTTWAVNTAHTVQWACMWSRK